MDKQNKIELEQKNLEIDKKVELIIIKALKYLKSYKKGFVDKEINKAYLYAKNAHKGQFRLSGDPYIIHPVEATDILLSLHPDINTIQACLLHDVVEDTEVTLKQIEENFGKEVSFLCAGMEKISKIRYKGEEKEREIGSLRKMFIAMAEDLRVIFIKLSDRVHNMKTLKYHPKREKQEKIANETLNIYAPIADRLGLFGMKNLLEEECFKILNEDEHKKLEIELKEIKKGSKIYLKEAEKEIVSLLNKEGIKNYKIDYRTKSIYSIYKKLKKKDLTDINSLYDVFGIRIVVNNISDCYKTLGTLHNRWTPLPNRFKDYIALPKPNGYKALHTTLVGLLNKNKKQPAEIQIKTYEMMEYAEIGVAAHFEYKEKGNQIAKDINWVKDLKEITQNLENNDFESGLKIDIFNDRIFVFTPKGDNIDLPSGSTVVDFAYFLHSDLGNQISIAKVNGKIYPLDKELKNGDIIEIIVDKFRKPNPFWLSFVKTNRAKSRIKSFLKREDKELHRERGKEIMNNFLEKSGFGKFDKELSILKIIEGTSYKMEDRWGLLEQIGNFSITASNLMRRIVKTNRPELINKNKGSNEKGIEKLGIKGENKKIIIGGDDNIKYKIASCCKTKISGKIVAHINGDSIISIHQLGCKTLKDANKDRILPAYIEGEKLDSIFTKIKLEVEDTIGVLFYITQVIFNMKVNIDEIHQIKSISGNREIVLIVEIKDYDYLLIDRLVNRISLALGQKLINKTIVEIK